MRKKLVSGIHAEETRRVKPSRRNTGSGDSVIPAGCTFRTAYKDVKSLKITSESDTEETFRNTEQNR